MLDILDDYLPPPASPLPGPSVFVISMNERSVGLGNHVGLETRGGFAAVALKGLRLDALIRFQLWATTPNEVDTAISSLNSQLLTDRKKLVKQGFLRLSLATTSLATHIATLGTWHKTSDFSVLYEFSYQDADGADSLIARIPILSDPETRNSPERETTVVTDEMVRWDNEATPALILRGRLSLGGLSALAFIPGTAPSGAVTLTRTFDAAPGAPTVYPSLVAFLAATSASNAPERHGQVSFASINDFLATFSADGDPVELGDWDTNGVADSYEAKLLAMEPVIELRGTAERFELVYQGNGFDHVGVVYLRIRRG